MGLTVDGTAVANLHAPFDPERFAIMHNTIATGKLALLGGAGLAAFLTDHGASPRLYTQVRPVSSIPANVMLGWIRCIDCDHQWRKFSTRDNRQYGEGTFPLWQDCTARNRIFRVVFRDWENGAANFPDLGDACTPVGSRRRVVRMRKGVVFACVAVALLGAQSASAGKGPFRYRHVGHIGPAVTPDGIAIDQQCGEIYIADPGAKVVHRYDQFGKLINNIGIPNSEARGGLREPRGLFLANSVVQPLNALGPPVPCSGTGLLWVTDYSESRINVFKPDGTIEGIWCGKTTNPAGICDLTTNSRTGYDFYPNDVWVTDDRVWVAGRLGNSITEYDLSGNFVRSVSTGGAYSVAQWGTNLWATHSGNGDPILALYSADPTAGKDIPLVHVWPWKLDGPTENLTSVWTGIDGTLYMLDRRGLEVFSPSGQPRSVTPLPDSYRPIDVAVRYDGTVYVVGEFTKGAEVFSPGATVTLTKLPGKKSEIVLAGSVVPAHPKNQIVIQRSEADGWHTLKALRLDSRSKFVYHWTPPRAKVQYQVRLVFHDPHPYHADRESAILTVASG